MGHAAAQQSGAMVLLHSVDAAANADTERPRLSLLACGEARMEQPNEFNEVCHLLSSDLARYAHCWLGYFGYEMLHGLEVVPPQPASYIDLPRSWLAQFSSLYVFDHAARSLTLYGEDAALEPLAVHAVTAPKLVKFFSPMSRQEYFSAIARTVEQIHAGAFYQANITRKFCGEFTHAADGYGLFLRLCDESPAVYSAFMRLPGGQCILSSSPECFLSLDGQGGITSRPIKGTWPRGNDPIKEAEALRLSSKNRAENLMIVDLMRNDFSRICMAGSITVEGLWQVTSHAHLHHLVSTVKGRLSEGVSVADALRATFPPGSMTGAPKVSAMRHCAAMEGVARGIYSGALGWFGGDGSADLSVVIRTLVLDGARFEFQVGGGIIADSSAEDEWRETHTKARAILATVGVDAAMQHDIW